MSSWESARWNERETRGESRRTMKWNEWMMMVQEGTRPLRNSLVETVELRQEVKESHNQTVWDDGGMRSLPERV